MQFGKKWVRNGLRRWLEVAQKVGPKWVWGPFSSQINAEIHIGPTFLATSSQRRKPISNPLAPDELFDDFSPEGPLTHCSP